VAAHGAVDALDAALFFLCDALIEFAVEVGQFALHLGVIGKAGPVNAGSGYGTARFALMAAVAEAAVRGEGGDIVERRVDTVGASPQLQLA
jgi:hypothetical protein